jgi:hypothetical protein
LEDTGNESTVLYINIDNGFEISYNSYHENVTIVNECGGLFGTIEQFELYRVEYGGLDYNSD